MLWGLGKGYVSPQVVSTCTWCWNTTPRPLHTGWKEIEWPALPTMLVIETPPLVHSTQAIRKKQRSLLSTTLVTACPEQHWSSFSPPCVLFPTRACMRCKVRVWSYPNMTPCSDLLFLLSLSLSSSCLLRPEAPATSLSYDKTMGAQETFNTEIRNVSVKIAQWSEEDHTKKKVLKMAPLPNGLLAKAQGISSHTHLCQYNPLTVQNLLHALCLFASCGRYFSATYTFNAHD